MGTIERGESNLSFQNIVKVAETLGVSLSVLFADLERAAGETQGRGVRGAQKKRPDK